MLRAFREHVSRSSNLQYAVPKLEQRGGPSFKDLASIGNKVPIRKIKVGADRAHETRGALKAQHQHSYREDSRNQALQTQKEDTLTFEELRYESDVLNDHKGEDRSQRMIDQGARSHDMKLWLQLLEFRARLDGQEGIRDVWNGMRRRQVDLPTRGSDAIDLWTIFSGPLSPSELFDYAQELYQRTRESYEGLYVLLIKPLLGTDPKSALNWSRRLKKINVRGQRSLPELVDEALKTPNSLQVFRHLYVRQKHSSLYDTIIPALCGRHLFQEALFWHRYLLSNEDSPTHPQATEELWCHFRDTGSHHICEEIAKSLVDRGMSLARSVITVKEDTAVERDSLPGHDMVFVPGQYVGPAPAFINDDYAARAFATKTFGLNIISVWMCAFGLERLGPLAMRELSIRCVSPQEITERIQAIEEKRVIISDHPYCRLIQQLALQNNQYLLDSVLQSDLHPDVYDDAQTQRKLLRSYMQRKDWPQLHRTLFVLTTFHRERAVSVWNHLLHSYMERADWPMIRSISNDMLHHGVSWTPTTVKKSFHLLLPKRSPGKRPELTSSESTDNVNLVINLWLQVLRAGGRVPPTAWRQVYIHLGMEGRMAELEILTLWLVHHYCKRGNGGAFPVQRMAQVAKRMRLRSFIRWQRRSEASTHEYDDPIKHLFPAVRLRAIIEWSIKTLGRPVPRSSRHSVLALPGVQSPASETEHTRHWTRGLRLLHFMRRRGIPVNTSTVRKACVQRFRLLFGGHVSSKKENRIAVAQNPLSLVQMVREVNQIWHERVFVVPMHVLRDDAALKKLIVGDKQRRATRRQFRLPRHPMARRTPETRTY